MRCKTFLVLVPILASAQAQSERSVHYNLLLNQASVHAAKGEYHQAFADYDSAFAHVPWGLWQRSEAASLALAQGDTAHALSYLEDIYRRGGEPLIAYSPELKGLLAKGFEEPTLGQLQSAINEWSNRADSTWIKALIEMKELDQSVRGKDNAKMLFNDSVNLERLITICRERGFPSQARVGASFGIVSLLFWHHRGEMATSAQFNVFSRLLKEAIARGEVEPDFLCGMQDFDDDKAGRPMRYGTLLYYYHERGHIKLVDRSELNRNRASVGLVPIEDFALQLGIDLDAVTQP